MWHRSFFAWLGAVILCTLVLSGADASLSCTTTSGSDVCACQTGSFKAPITLPGLNALYLFDSDTRDSSGNAYDLTMTNGAASPYSSLGVNGVDPSLKIKDESTLLTRTATVASQNLLNNIVNGKPVGTLAVWVKDIRFVDGNDHQHGILGLNWADGKWFRLDIQASGSLVFAFYGGAWGTTSMFPECQNSPDWTRGGWWHIVFTSDGTNVGIQYRSAADASYTSCTLLSEQSGNPVISTWTATGSVSASSIETFKINAVNALNPDTLLDEVRVYNRVLSSDEILQVFDEKNNVCKSCGAGLTTLAPGANSSDACGCEVGSFASKAYHQATTTSSWQGDYDYAIANGGRLLTKDEAIAHCSVFSYNVNEWIPVTRDDGKEDHVGCKDWTVTTSRGRSHCDEYGGCASWTSEQTNSYSFILYVKSMCQTCGSGMTTLGAGAESIEACVCQTGAWSPASDAVVLFNPPLNGHTQTFTSTTTYDLGPAHFNIGTDGFTAVGKIDFGSASDYERAFCFRPNGDNACSGSNPKITLYRNLGGNSLYFGMWNGNSDGCFSIFGSLSSGTKHSIVVRYHPQTGLDMLFDGTRSGPHSCSYSFADLTYTKIEVGVNSFAGEIDGLYAFNRYLSDAEAEAVLATIQTGALDDPLHTACLTCAAGLTTLAAGAESADACTCQLGSYGQPALDFWGEAACEAASTAIGYTWGGKKDYKYDGCYCSHKDIVTHATSSNMKAGYCFYGRNWDGTQAPPKDMEPGGLPFVFRPTKSNGDYLSKTECEAGTSLPTGYTYASTGTYTIKGCYCYVSNSKYDTTYASKCYFGTPDPGLPPPGPLESGGNSHEALFRPMPYEMCTSCGVGLTTLESGAESADQCVCESGSYGPHGPLDGLVALFGFDGDLEDEVGDASIQNFDSALGPATFVSDGVRGQALDTSTRNLAIDSVALADVLDQDAWTVTMWVYQTDNSEEIVLFDRADTGTVDNKRGGVGVFVFTTGRLYVERQQTGGNSWVNIQSPDSPNGILNLNTWYHLGFVATATDMRIYINGADVASETLAAGKSWEPTRSTLTKKIGLSLHCRKAASVSPDCVTDRKKNGLRQDLRFYNRALTPAEITALAARTGDQANVCATCPAETPYTSPDQPATSATECKAAPAASDGCTTIADPSVQSDSKPHCGDRVGLVFDFFYHQLDGTDYPFTWQKSQDAAVAAGGRLPTTTEMKQWVQETGGYNDADLSDHWIATTDSNAAGGNFVQVIRGNYWLGKNIVERMGGNANPPTTTWYGTTQGQTSQTYLSLYVVVYECTGNFVQNNVTTAKSRYITFPATLSPYTVAFSASPATTGEVLVVSGTEYSHVSSIDLAGSYTVTVGTDASVVQDAGGAVVATSAGGIENTTIEYVVEEKHDTDNPWGFNAWLSWATAPITLSNGAVYNSRPLTKEELKALTGTPSSPGSGFPKSGAEYAFHTVGPLPDGTMQYAKIYVGSGTSYSQTLGDSGQDTQNQVWVAEEVDPAYVNDPSRYYLGWMYRMKPIGPAPLVFQNAITGSLQTYSTPQVILRYKSEVCPSDGCTITEQDPVSSTHDFTTSAYLDKGPISDGTTDQYMLFKYDPTQDTSGQTTYDITFSDETECDILIVAGGGAGGRRITSSSNGGAGGGAGGLLFSQNVKLTGSVSISVGRGGVNTAQTERGEQGIDSSVGALTAIGGGGGGSRKHDGDDDATGIPSVAQGGDGGSGGGSCFVDKSGNHAYEGGTGTPGQGHDGGKTKAPGIGAGGGGAGGRGGGINGVENHDGGIGLYEKNSINFKTHFYIPSGIGHSSGGQLYFAGGGGGGEQGDAENQGTGGLGGGGDGGDSSDGKDASDHTGGGGGGASNVQTSYRGGHGGSGIVIIRYKMLRKNVCDDDSTDPPCPLDGTYIASCGCPADYYQTATAGDTTCTPCPDSLVSPAQSTSVDQCTQPSKKVTFSLSLTGAVSAAEITPGLRGRIKAKIARNLRVSPKRVTILSVQDARRRLLAVSLEVEVTAEDEAEAQTLTSETTSITSAVEEAASEENVTLTAELTSSASEAVVATCCFKTWPN